MTESYWNIRFGQIFRHQLQELEELQSTRYWTRLQDCFFFHPEEPPRPPASESPFDAINLNHNVGLYRKHFTPIRSVKPRALNEEFAEKFPASIVIASQFPPFELRPSSNPLDELQHLLSLGLDIRFMTFDSPPESAHQMADKMRENLEQWTDLKPRVLLVSHSLATLGAFELLQAKEFREKNSPIIGLVTLSGPVDGLSSGELYGHSRAQLIWNVYEKVLNHIDKPIDARSVKGLREALDPSEEWASAVRKLIEDIEDMREDFAFVPTAQNLQEPDWNNWTKPETLPDHLPLFSISAICPRQYLRGKGKFPRNPDDLFLYLLSKEIAQINPYTDGQTLLPQTTFSKDLENAVHLATVCADHWGLLFPRVFCRATSDPFPRPAFWETLLLTIDEYLTSRG